MAVVRHLAGIAAILIAAIVLAPRGEAHKPITSPFTFNEDVLPIVRDRCAACHVTGGVAPMSLLTHAEAVPWGESIRVELLSGHMPPWAVDGAPAGFRNVQMLSAREMNVLLTWVSGGTPAGDPAKAPSATAGDRTWPLGAPDLVLPLPNDVTLTPDMQDHVAEFTIPVPADAPRWLRAVDVLPGTPAIVRSAVVSVKTAGRADAARGASAVERTLAVWVPGDPAVPLDEGTAFELPPGADISVRIRYRKTWEYERATMTDRSRIGLYFAPQPSSELRAIELEPEATAPPTGALSFATVTREPLRALGVYPDPAFANANVSVVATRPNGSREALIAFRPQSGWARRYWFNEPILLPAGSRLDVNVAWSGEALLPPGAIPPDPPDPSSVRLILNVIPE